jgi:predicted nuclease of predicted toxin-antitoxin system
VKLKIDENLPAALVAAFGGRGHDVDTVIDEQLVGASDPTVLQAATSESRMLVPWTESSVMSGPTRPVATLAS